MAASQRHSTLPGRIQALQADDALIQMATTPEDYLAALRDWAGYRSVCARGTPFDDAHRRMHRVVQAAWA